MNIETPTPNKLSVELGRQLRWGKKTNAAAASVMAASLERAATIVAAKSAIQQKGLVWELMPGSPPLQRIVFRSRMGLCWSYPYGHIAMIHLPSACLITLKCTSGDVEAIVIHGTGLDNIFTPLSEHRVAMLCESDNPLIPMEGVIVREIVVVASARKNEPHSTEIDFSARP